MKSPHILLVEDEVVIANDVQYFLESSGCQVALATDECEVFSFCQKQLPTLLVLNFHQKKLPDGMALARRLRTEFPEIQILMLTGARQLDLKASIDWLPNVYILHKPFSRRQLREAFFHYLS